MKTEKTKIVKLDAQDYSRMRDAIRFIHDTTESGICVNPKAILNLCKNALKARAIK